MYILSMDNIIHLGKHTNTFSACNFNRIEFVARKHSSSKISACLNSLNRINEIRECAQILFKWTWAENFHIYAKCTCTCTFHIFIFKYTIIMLARHRILIIIIIICNRIFRHYTVNFCKWAFRNKKKKKHTTKNCNLFDTFSSVHFTKYSCYAMALTPTAWCKR